jgi:hypothetical protein
LCVKFSFSKPDNWAKSEVHNLIIDEEIKLWKEFGGNKYPALMINNRTYKG